ncbi:MAG: hypothetical protein PHY29_08770 [Syntrophales bacterium]|nr:hypothetical protein [Syntrophales bacterium]
MKTRVTELFHMIQPILSSGMGWIMNHSGETIAAMNILYRKNTTLEWNMF